MLELGLLLAGLSVFIAVTGFGYLVYFRVREEFEIREKRRRGFGEPWWPDGHWY